MTTRLTLEDLHIATFITTFEKFDGAFASSSRRSAMKLLTIGAAGPIRDEHCALSASV
jgi:hypothetical protein